jgi:hypothetical protein
MFVQWARTEPSPSRSSSTAPGIVRYAETMRSGERIVIVCV